MMKSEFESLAIRGNGTISGLLYRQIEYFYTSENEYHAKHGGIYETKQEFVRRVFGGKVNTPKSIKNKIISEAIRENRWALRYSSIATKERLDEMDQIIREHYEYLSRHDY